MMANRNVQRGFTLIEVMIAAVILFTVLGFASLAVKNARQSSESAADSIVLYEPVPLIVDQIREVLQQQAAEQLQGSGAIFGVQYQWTADRLQFAPPVPRFDPDLTIFVSYKPRFAKYQVHLSLKKDNKSRDLTYQELSWTGIQPEL